MPNLYPSPLPDATRRDPRRRAEVRVYDTLAAQLDSAWWVFHSVAWLGKSTGDRVGDGEADFVIVHPERGAMTLEVKGGGIRYDAYLNQWFSENAGGHWNKIKDPFEQARTSKHALLNKLREYPKLKSRFWPMAHAVCFPGVVAERADLKTDAPRDVVLDRSDLERMPQALERVFAHFHAEREVEPLTPVELNTLRDVLARCSSCACPWGRRRATKIARSSG